jgi:hypothetical protein
VSPLTITPHRCHVTAHAPVCVGALRGLAFYNGVGRHCIRDIAGPKYQRENIGLQHERRVCDPKIGPNAERLLWTWADKLAPKRSMPSNVNTPAEVYGQLQLSSKNISRCCVIKGWLKRAAAKLAAMRWNETEPNGTEQNEKPRIRTHYGTVWNSAEHIAAVS